MGGGFVLPSGAHRWWRVVAARVEGVTAPNALYREPATAQWAVRREAGDGISRTGGLKSAALPQKRGEEELVQADQPDQQLLNQMREECHRGEDSSCSSAFCTLFEAPRHSRRTVFIPISGSSFRQITTRSCPTGSIPSHSRKAARTMRLRRERRTEFPALFEAVIPRREARPGTSLRAKIHTKCAVLTRRPLF